MLMALRALVWRADESLYRAELRLREDLAREGAAQVPGKGSLGKTLTLPTVVRSAAKPGLVREPKSHPLARVTFSEWEARRSGVAPVAKRRRRARSTAADFDLDLRERFERRSAS